MDIRALLMLGVVPFSPFQPLLGSTSYASIQGAISEVKSSIPTPEERAQDLKEFMVLRQFWFSVKPSEANIKPSAEFPNIFSVIMDWPIQSKSNGVVQVLVGAVSDGTSSLLSALAQKSLEATPQKIRRCLL